MSQFEPDAKIRCYLVKTWIPPSEGYRYGRHKNFGVVCESATAAINLVSAYQPIARIDSVNEVAVVHIVGNQ